jgi:hypothetical protein
MENTAPYEIIAAPCTLWLAPTGTAFPAIDEAPGGSWTKIGTSGDRNYIEDGVTVQHAETVAKFRSAGSTGVRKLFRTEEDLVITVTLADLTLEQYKQALNGNTVTDSVGDPKKIGLSKGMTVTQYALLVRGPSPYGDDFNLQYEVPVVGQTGSQEVTFRKGEPAALQLEFTAVEDPNASSDDERYGRLKAQDATSET